MDYTLLVMGILSLLFGFGLRYWINRRRFYRTNFAGGEGFSSYEKLVLIRFFERLGKLLAYILILAGIFFIWGHSRLKKENTTKNFTTEIHIPEKKEN
ncbi:molybdenum ABC transporter permease [Flavobacterium sp. UBA6135]|mgnify:CR=1 FL=1|uniref:molybdenum ABC transporter permease n=1 Tax=Flavobacterium sp. UBA6135 TaxID=1946553 RepID=UPI0025BB9AA3|nr:molybdenum ABC transporter permease [Flavobacterium sp. UBA6135]